MKTYPKMKDSGIEGIGKIPKHWNLQKIKHTSYVKGRIGWQGLRTDEYTDKGPFLITGTDFKNGKIDWKNCNHVEQWRFEQDLHIQIKENDILITKDGTIGKIAFIDNLPDQTTLNSGVMVLRPVNNAYDPQFLFWILKSQQFTEFINFIKTGSTINHLYQEKFENFQFVLPESFNEQKIIFDYLNEIIPQINSKIEKNLKILGFLEEKKQTTINQAVTKGLDDSVLMKDSGVKWIGNVPEHWEVRKIKTISKVKRGASPRPIDDTKYFDENGEYAWVRISDVTASNGILKQTKQSLSTLGANLSVKLNVGELFLSIAGSVGKQCITKIPCCIHDGFVYFPMLKILKKYLYFIFEAGECYKGLGKLGTQLNLNTDTVGNIVIPYPPKKEQTQIIVHLEKQTSKIDELILKTESQINKLQEYRQSLISSTITGKIDVREIVA